MKRKGDLQLFLSSKNFGIPTGCKEYGSVFLFNQSSIYHATIDCTLHSLAT